MSRSMSMDISLSEVESSEVESTLDAGRNSTGNSRQTGTDQSLTTDCRTENTATTADNSVETENTLSGVISTLRHFASLSELIRFGGAAAIVGSMFMFLVGGVDIINDQHRFYSMLFFTGLLTTAGLATSWILKEQRSSRAFFGLALISVPVNFTVLGALYYSVFGAEAATLAYPALAKWTVPDMASLGFTTAIAIAALIPLTLLSFSIMARQSHKWLSCALLGSSILLLLPLRDSAVIVPLVAVSSLVLMWFLRRNSQGVIALKTPAGRFARALLFLPLVIMLARSVWLYQLDTVAALIACATLYVLLRHLSERLSADSILQNFLHIVSAATGLIVAVLLTSLSEHYVGTGLNGGVFSLVTAILTIELQARIKNSTLQRTLSLCGSALAVTISISSVIFFSSSSVILLCVLTAVVLLSYGLITRRIPEALCAMVLIVTITVFQLSFLVGMISAAGWWGVAGMGATAILLASILERYGTIVSLRAKQWINGKNKSLHTTPLPRL